MIRSPGDSPEGQTDDLADDTDHSVKTPDFYASLPLEPRVSKSGGIPLLVRFEQPKEVPSVRTG